MRRCVLGFVIAFALFVTLFPFPVSAMESEKSEMSTDSDYTVASDNPTYNAGIQDVFNAEWIPGAGDYGEELNLDPGYYEAWDEARLMGESSYADFISNQAYRQHVNNKIDYYLSNYTSLKDALQNGKPVVFFFEGQVITETKAATTGLTTGQELFALF